MKGEQTSARGWQVLVLLRSVCLQIRPDLQPISCSGRLPCSAPALKAHSGQDTTGWSEAAPTPTFLPILNLNSVMRTAAPSTEPDMHARRPSRSSQLLQPLQLPFGLLSHTQRRVTLLYLSSPLLGHVAKDIVRVF